MEILRDPAISAIVVALITAIAGIVTTLLTTRASEKKWEAARNHAAYPSDQGARSFEPTGSGGTLGAVLRSNRAKALLAAFGLLFLCSCACLGIAVLQSNDSSCTWFVNPFTGMYECR
jgi:hypothetical protein